MTRKTGVWALINDGNWMHFCNLMFFSFLPVKISKILSLFEKQQANISWFFSPLIFTFLSFILQIAYCKCLEYISRQIGPNFCWCWHVNFQTPTKNFWISRNIMFLTYMTYDVLDYILYEETFNLFHSGFFCCLCFILHPVFFSSAPSFLLLLLATFNIDKLSNTLSNG